MGDKTAIECGTDATWNPTVGCSIVSPGCTNCYAMNVASGLERRFGSPKYAGLTKVVNGNPVWTGEVRLDEDALLQPLRWKKPRRIFVNSMSDLFHEALTDDAIDRVIDIMARTKRHTYQVLTKRAERMRDYMLNLSANLHRLPILWHETWPLPNVWWGTSAERQQEADERIPLLLETPAAVRFVSLEPLLGAIDLRQLTYPKTCGCENHSPKLDAFDASVFCGGCCEGPERMNIGHVDWVIVGGESGPHARPMHPDWARSLRDQCTAAGVPFFFKQWGEWLGTKPHEAKPPAGSCHEWNGGNCAWRVGKRAAGRLLDGREWSEFPEPRGAA